MTTGSISIATSASAASVNCVVMSDHRRASCVSSRNVGVPPPSAGARASRRAPSRCGDQRQLAPERRQVALDAPLVARDDHVAAAVAAQLLAERDVHVERERLVAGGAGLSERARVVVGAEAVGPRRHRRIAGVARRRDFEPSQDLRGDAHQRFTVANGSASPLCIIVSGNARAVPSAGRGRRGGFAQLLRGGVADPQELRAKPRWRQISEHDSRTLRVRERSFRRSGRLLSRASHAPCRRRAWSTVSCRYLTAHPL